MRSRNPYSYPRRRKTGRETRNFSNILPISPSKYKHPPYFYEADNVIWSLYNAQPVAVATSSVGNAPSSRLLYSLHRDVCASTWRVCVVSVTCALIEDYNGGGDTRRSGLEGGRDRGEWEGKSCGAEQMYRGRGIDKATRIEWDGEITGRGWRDLEMVDKRGYQTHSAAFGLGVWCAR